MAKKSTAKSKPYSLNAERLRLKKLTRKSCAWGRKGKRCMGCEEQALWLRNCAEMSCSDWEEYRDCKMDNDRALAFLEHVKTCSYCSIRRYRLMKRRNIWWELERRNLQPLIEKLASKLQTRKISGNFFRN